VCWSPSISPSRVPRAPNDDDNLKHRRYLLLLLLSLTLSTSLLLPSGPSLRYLTNSKWHFPPTGSRWSAPSLPFPTPTPLPLRVAPSGSLRQRTFPLRYVPHRLLVLYFQAAVPSLFLLRCIFHSTLPPYHHTITPSYHRKGSTVYHSLPTSDQSSDRFFFPSRVSLGQTHLHLTTQVKQSTKPVDFFFSIFPFQTRLRSTFRSSYETRKSSATATMSGPPNRKPGQAPTSRSPAEIEAEMRDQAIQLAMMVRCFAHLTLTCHSLLILTGRSGHRARRGITLGRRVQGPPSRSECAPRCSQLPSRSAIAWRVTIWREWGGLGHEPGVARYVALHLKALATMC
jgi:hypothetical protein